MSQATTLLTRPSARHAIETLPWSQPTSETAKGRDCSLDRAQTLLGGAEQTDDFKKYMAHIQQKYDTLSKQSPSCRQCKLYEEMLALAKEREICSK